MHRYRFGKFSDAETAHVTGLPVEEVFSDNVEENTEYFLPLLAVDLSELNDNWSGYAHFLYGGLNAGGISFKMRDEGDSTFLTFDGEYNFDEDDMEGRDVKQGYMDFEEVDPPAGAEGEDEDWMDHVDEWKEVLEGIDDEMLLMCHIGGMPFWTQNDDTPSCSSCDNDMTFVGQVRSTDLSHDVDEVDVFLFYCHGCRIQTQIDQTT